MDELTQVLYLPLANWNQHAHPYFWKKRPQEQVTILGAFGVRIRSDDLAILREDK